LYLCNCTGRQILRGCIKMRSAISLIILLGWGATLGWAKLLLPPYHLKSHHIKHNHIPLEGEVGTKLILTPYIEQGNIEEARNLSAVRGEPIPDDIPSYSGFFTVNENYNSNLFFWFFPAEVS